MQAYLKYAYLKYAYLKYVHLKCGRGKPLDFNPVGHIFATGPY